MAKGRGSREETRKKYRKVIIILLLIYFTVGVMQNRDSIFHFILESIGADAYSHIIPVSEEWNLIVEEYLLNRLLSKTFVYSNVKI